MSKRKQRLKSYYDLGFNDVFKPPDIRMLPRDKSLIKAYDKGFKDGLAKYKKSIETVSFNGYEDF